MYMISKAPIIIYIIGIASSILIGLIGYLLKRLIQSFDEFKDEFQDMKISYQNNLIESTKFQAQYAEKLINHDDRITKAEKSVSELYNRHNKHSIEINTLKQRCDDNINIKCNSKNNNK